MYTLRAPRSTNVHAMAPPPGDATRFAGKGKSSTCSSENEPSAWADNGGATRAADIDAIATTRESEKPRRDMVPPRNRRIIIVILLDAFLSDVRFAVRWLRKSPGFALV